MAALRAGPCYRCLFPDPPRPENCSRCSEAGVLGPVPGLIGTLQALEAVKILSGEVHCLSRLSCGSAGADDNGHEIA